MKKIIVSSVILILLLTIAICFSYVIAKNQAYYVAQDYQEQMSPLKGNLILFIDDTFSPCWIFRGEHKELLTGTFDVYVTFFGNVINGEGETRGRP